jgi:hypothetical protein
MVQPLREEDVLARVATALAEPGEPVLIFDAWTFRAHTSNGAVGFASTLLIGSSGALCVRIK